MKTSLTEKYELIIQPENIVEMLALRAWNENEGKTFLIKAYDAEQSVQLMRFPACKGCEFNPCDTANNSDYCPARN